jgi:hypothetical protein
MNRMIWRTGAAAFVILAACSNPNPIPNSSVTNVMDTLTLWSLTDGPLVQPTAYSINNRSGVRTWEVGINFEFAFDENGAGQPVFLPIKVLKLLPTGAFQPGLRRETVAAGFDQMTKAPLNGYIVSDTIPIAVNDRFYVRTTVSSCSLLGVPLYAKLEVLELDSIAHTVRFRAVANQNCGYRSLKLGLPKE